MIPNVRDALETISRGARESYEHDQELMPALFLFAEGNGIALHPNPDLDETVPLCYAQVLYRVGKLAPWRVIGTASEVWKGEFKQDDPVVDQIERGSLEKLASEGNTNVKTAIVSFVIDLDVRARSLFKIDTPHLEDDGTVTWDSVESKGIPEGDMADLLLHAYDTAPDPPDQFLTRIPLAVICELLVYAEIATAAVLL